MITTIHHIHTMHPDRILGPARNAEAITNRVTTMNQNRPTLNMDDTVTFTVTYPDTKILYLSMILSGPEKALPRTAGQKHIREGLNYLSAARVNIVRSWSSNLPI